MVRIAYGTLYLVHMNICTLLSSGTHSKATPLKKTKTQNPIKVLSGSVESRRCERPKTRRVKNECDLVDRLFVAW